MLVSLGLSAWVQCLKKKKKIPEGKNGEMESIMDSSLTSRCIQLKKKKR